MRSAASRRKTCYIVVDDADAHCRAAKAAGASIVLDITDDDHGGRGYACRDPEGHIWSFGTYDPWQPRAAPHRARGRGRGVVMAAVLIGAAIACGLRRLDAAAVACSRPIESRLQHDASAARERLETRQPRAHPRWRRSCRRSAAPRMRRSGRHAKRRSSWHATRAPRAAPRPARGSWRSSWPRRGAPTKPPSQKAKEANSQIVGERAARQAAERASLDTAKELTRERDARQRAERSAQDAVEQLTRERRAKDEAERAATQAREQLAQALADRVEADPEEAEQHKQSTSGAGTGKTPTGGVAPGSDGMTD